MTPFKQATSGGLDGWGWNESSLLFLCVGLAWILRLVEDTGQWPKGLFDAYIAMIPQFGILGQGRTPFDTLVYIGKVPSGLNLNRYASWGSSIPWHSDNEPLFGDQGDPKVIVSLSLGSSVDSRVSRRGRRNAPSLIMMDHRDLLVMDGLAQSEYVHSTFSELQGPWVNLAYRLVPITPRPPGRCGPGPVGLCHRVCKVWCARFARAGLPRGKRGYFQCRFWGGLSSGWWSSRASYWRTPRLPTGVAWPLALPCLSLLPHSGAIRSSTRAGGRAGVEEDGGGCRGVVGCPNGGIGNSLSGIIVSRGEKWVT